MPALLIVLMSILAAVCYGIVHDQITARICVEYFTVGHPPVFHTDDPTLLGLGWGVIATWWAGALLGVPLAIAARVGSRPRRSPVSLLRPIAVLLSVMGASALAAGWIGWRLAETGQVRLFGPLADALPRQRHVPFLIDAFAHSTSYVVGFVGGLAVIAWVWRSRIVAQAELDRQA